MKNLFKILALVISLIFILLIKDAERISEIDKIISGYKFNLISWELRRLPKQTIDFFKSSNLTKEEAEKILNEVDFSRMDNLELYYEKNISNLIKNELDKNFLFPPLAISLEKPPKVLIVSPKDKISQKIAILLSNDISIAEIESIESRIDSLNLSSIILDTGGFAAYPSLINIKKDSNFMISTISHEWLHHYLFFFPLGRSYFKGQDMIFINETLADLFADEIIKNEKNNESDSIKFFKDFMKETRIKVDILLLNDEIDLAEEYMMKRTIELNNKGYTIRKINQAYFAFHGNYGTSPSSTHNYHEILTELLGTYNSFNEFLEDIKKVDSVKKLENIINLRSHNN